MFSKRISDEKQGDILDGIASAPLSEDGPPDASSVQAFVHTLFKKYGHSASRFELYMDIICEKSLSENAKLAYFMQIRASVSATEWEERSKILVFVHLTLANYAYAYKSETPGYSRAAAFHAASKWYNEAVVAYIKLNDQAEWQKYQSRQKLAKCDEACKQADAAYQAEYESTKGSRVAAFQAALPFYKPTIEFLKASDELKGEWEKYVERQTQAIQATAKACKQADDAYDAEHPSTKGSHIAAFQAALPFYRPILGILKSLDAFKGEWEKYVERQSQAIVKACKQADNAYATVFESTGSQSAAFKASLPFYSSILEFLQSRDDFKAERKQYVARQTQAIVETCKEADDAYEAVLESTRGSRNAAFQAVLPLYRPYLGTLKFRDLFKGELEKYVERQTLAIVQACKQADEAYEAAFASSGEYAAFQAALPYYSSVYEFLTARVDFKEELKKYVSRHKLALVSIIKPCQEADHVYEAVLKSSGGSRSAAFHAALPIYRPVLDFLKSSSELKSEWKKYLNRHSLALRQHRQNAMSASFSTAGLWAERKQLLKVIAAQTRKEQQSTASSARHSI